MLLLLPIVIIVLDQLTKNLSTKYLLGQAPYIIIPEHFEFRYVKNFGAAFGILQEKRTFFIILTTVVILFIIYFLYKNFATLNLVTKISILMLLGGAIGNYIDRVRLGYVVDFIRLNLIKSYDFPVFNIADIFIVCGTILIVYVVLFDKYEIKGV